MSSWCHRINRFISSIILLIASLLLIILGFINILDKDEFDKIFVPYWMIILACLTISDQVIFWKLELDKDQRSLVLLAFVTILRVGLVSFTICLVTAKLIVLNAKGDLPNVPKMFKFGFALSLVIISVYIFIFTKCLVKVCLARIKMYLELDVIQEVPEDFADAQV